MKAEDKTSSDLQEQMKDDPVGVIFDSILQIWEEFLSHLPLIVVGVVVFFLTWIFSRLSRSIFDWALSKSDLRIGLKSLFRQLTQIAIWIVGLLVVAIIIFPGMTPAKALTVLGLGSVAIGFAFKDIFENFFAGILILWRFPFDPGDYIACGDYLGEVKDIKIRMTTIEQTDGQLITLPNAKLFKDPVRVMTYNPKRRLSVICGVSYDTSLEEAQRIIEVAVKGCETVDQNRNVDVFAELFDASGINFNIRWWTTPRPIDEMTSRSEVIMAVKNALDNAGIEIPFPYRTLTFKESITVENTDSK